ncbi:hypothetical protein CYMTET_20584 [Cymbomonas tetramitiformis]|uniref:EF-hand domain-containing protein n=1 Tax=Cymbomonas tetramitiformis TaxID=36881 RepID=A0AAE0G3R5_9CHLO|nr:hypothetical protein CYMTET_20584 [Cymbomonas tetramitiformis]
MVVERFSSVEPSCRRQRHPDRTGLPTTNTDIQGSQGNFELWTRSRVPRPPLSDRDLTARSSSVPKHGGVRPDGSRRTRLKSADLACQRTQSCDGTLQDSKLPPAPIKWPRSHDGENKSSSLPSYRSLNSRTSRGAPPLRSRSVLNDLSSSALSSPPSPELPRSRFSRCEPPPSQTLLRPKFQRQRCWVEQGPQGDLRATNRERKKAYSEKLVNVAVDKKKNLHRLAKTGERVAVKEIRNLRRYFDELDKDNSGTVDMEEIKHHMHHCLDPEGAVKIFGFLNKLLSTYCQDGNELSFKAMLKLVYPAATLKETEEMVNSVSPEKVAVPSL